MIEYTARRELDGIPREWKCPRHAAPDEWMTPANRETTAVLDRANPVAVYCWDYL